MCTPWEAAFLQEGAVAAGGISGVLCGLFPYLPLHSTHGNLSVYARGLDYHLWVRAALARSCTTLKATYPSHYFEPFCDISPFAEVSVAAACGLGVVGQNSLLISPIYGSYVFIGTIKTDLPLPNGKEAQPCLRCGRCASLCPTGAIGEKGVSPVRCLSHISQKRGALTAWEQVVLAKSDLIWGCDLCQQVCPLNLHKSSAKNALELQASLSLLDLTGLSDRAFRRKYHNYAFAFRGIQPLKRNLLLHENKLP